MDLQDGKRMLGDIKSKLGFGSKNKNQPYDEYDDYDGYDDGYDDFDEGVDDGYDQFDDYGTPAARSSRYSSSSSSRSSFRTSSSRRDSSMPRLVSIEDVRANTQVPSSLSRDPLPSSRRTTVSSGYSSMGGSRTMVDASLPPQMTPEGTAATAASASRRRSSEGLDSLFTPTTGVAAEPAEPVVQTKPSYSGPTVTTRAAYDPYDSYASSTISSYSASRSLTVIKPASYGEVERVSRALKAGDAAVICLGNTQDSLAKRILDFSFGVASALDASVECIADKVFVIARGRGITESERADLRAQGVL